MFLYRCCITNPYPPPVGVGIFLGGSMKIRQLMDILAMMNPDADVFVAFFYANGTSETFDIEEVTDNNGHAQIEIYEEEPGA
jgi:hypothetical protein